MLCILLDPQFQDIIPFLKLIGDHFGDGVKRNGDHFRVGMFWGRFGDHFRVGDHFEGSQKELKQASAQPYIGSCNKWKGQKIGGRGGGARYVLEDIFNTEALLKIQSWGHFGHQLQLPQNFYTPHLVNLFRNFYQRNKLSKKIALSTT